MAEDYAAKMSRKTDAELRDYVLNRYQYQEEAVLAALQEAEQRQLTLPGVDAPQIRQELAGIVTQQQAARQQAEVVQAAAEAEALDEGPRLYSPTAITLFSLCFSTLLGGILLALNFRTLHRKGATLRLVAFFVGYLLVKSMLFSLGLFAFFFVADLVAVLAYNLWFWPRYVGVERYQSRSWLVLFLACLAGYLALIMLLQQQMPQLQQQLEAWKAAAAAR